MVRLPHIKHLVKILITDVSVGSEWQDGLSWMRVNTELMPVTKFAQLTINRDTEMKAYTECFDEPFQLSANFSRLESQVGYKACGQDKVVLLVDPIRLGWSTSL